MPTIEEKIRRLPEVCAFTEASRSLNRCKCGSRAVMVYTPGCTYIHCIMESKTVMALPDWQPIELARQWNIDNPKHQNSWLGKNSLR